MIEIGDTHTIVRDTYNWILISHPQGRVFKVPKKGKEYIDGKRTYFGSLIPLFDSVVNDRLKDAKDINDIAARLKVARSDVEETARRLEDAIYAHRHRVQLNVPPDSIEGDEYDE